MNTSKIKPYVPALLWMAVMFTLSTHYFGSALTKPIIGRMLDFIGYNYDTSFLNTADLVVRKSAHVFIYAVLAVLWYRAVLKGSRLGMVKAGLTVLLICALWASSDEIHQYLAGGRGAEVSDVVLDSATSALAIVVTGFISWAGKRKTPRGGGVSIHPTTAGD